MNRLDPREDLHALMASRLYCVSLDKVTPELRAKSKLYTFSWRYSPIRRDNTRTERIHERIRTRTLRRWSRGIETASKRHALVSACQLFDNMLSDCGIRLKSRAEW